MRCVVKWIVGVAAIVLYGGIALAQMAPTVSFTTPPAAGANPGEIAAAVKWTNCSGIAKVKVHLYKAGTMGADVVFATEEHPSTLQNGSWAVQFTKLKSGTVVKAATAETLTAGGAVIKSDTVTGLNVTVP